jgi:AAA family ATP:ADP antiporter
MSGASPALRLLQKLVRVEAREAAALLWSFLYFFCLLCGYYILRPLRDEMGIAGGIDQLPWVFTGTFLAMLAAVPLFGALTARTPRRVFVPAVYWFFIVNIFVFFALFQWEAAHAVTARAFFIWVSVYNLFVVSVFWSFMVDVFRDEQGKRLFGFIAAGGSLGAITGPLLTTQLAVSLGPVNLLPVSAAFLLGAVVAVHRLGQWARHQPQATDNEAALGGQFWAGATLVVRSTYLLGIALFIVLLTTLNTFVYFAQAEIVRAAFTGAAERTAFFATLDLAVNSLAIVTQALLTGRLIPRLGVPRTLAALPALSLLGFALLAAAPLLAVLAAFQVLRRAGDYALLRPARELLFAVVDRETKYKAKNFLDTVVFRAGDAAAAWLFAGLKGLGLTLTGIALLGVPIAAAWMGLSLWLGRRHDRNV